MFNWVYDLATHIFLYGGPSEANYDPLTQGVVSLAQHPNPRTDRYDDQDGIRPATEQELTDADAVQVVQADNARFNDDATLKALVIWVAGKQGMTVQDVQAELIQIVKSEAAQADSDQSIVRSVQ